MQSVRYCVAALTLEHNTVSCTYLQEPLLLQQLLPLAAHGGSIQLSTGQAAAGCCTQLALRRVVYGQEVLEELRLCSLRALKGLKHTLHAGNSNHSARRG